MPNPEPVPTASVSVESVPPIPEQRSLDTDEVYTIAEVCKLLKLSRATVDRMTGRGELPGRLKLGGQVRFHGPTLRRFLADSVRKVDNV